ncbi:predicted protein, partial [Nematostella vectensis]
SQFLNEAIYEEYKDAKTVYGFRLFDILSYDVSYRDTIGIRATDEECYYTFIKLFDPVISNFCSSYPRVEKNVSYVYPSNVVSLVGVTGTLDAHVVSCRVRVVRSLQGFPFAWVCSPNERREIQNVVKQALDSLKGVEYYKLARISSKSRDTLITKHGIFRNQKLDCDDTWSSGRGIWRDGTSNAIALVNEREHIIFLTQEFGGDLCHAFYRMRDLVERTELALEKTGHKYMHSVVYGFLVSSPQEVGTGLRISVNVKLPHL